MADGMTVKAWYKIFRMFAPIHENLPVSVRSCNIHDVDLIQDVHFRKFHSVWSHDLPRAAGRLASGMRLERIIETIVQQGAGPWLKWNFTVFQIGIPRNSGGSARTSALSHV